MKETKNSIIVFMTAIFLATVMEVNACAPFGDGGKHEREEGGEVVVLQFPAVLLSPEEQLAVDSELMEAVKEGDEKRVADALARGAQSHLRRYRGQYPLLIEAVRSRRGAPGEVIKLLLGAKARIDEQSSFHRTAFHYAAMQGDVEVMELLKKAGAQIDIPDSFGESPLMLATFPVRRSAVHWLLRAGVAVDASNKQGTTALMKSVFSANGFDLTDRLLGEKALVNMQDHKGDTALMMIVLKHKETGEWFFAPIKKLILAGANPFICNEKNKSAWSEATEDIKLVMRNAREERELGKFTSEILRRNIRPTRNIRLQLPEHIACLVEEFATAPFSDCDIARRGRELAKSRALWLARTEDDIKEDDDKKE